MGPTFGPRAPSTTCSPPRMNSSASTSRRCSSAQRNVSISSSRPRQTQSSRNPCHLTSGSTSPAAASKSPRRRSPKKAIITVSRFSWPMLGIPPPWCLHIVTRGLEAAQGGARLALDVGGARRTRSRAPHSWTDARACSPLRAKPPRAGPCSCRPATRPCRQAPGPSPPPTCDRRLGSQASWRLRPKTRPPRRRAPTPATALRSPCSWDSSFQVDGGLATLDRHDSRGVVQERRKQAPRFVLGCEDGDDPRRVRPGCATLVHEPRTFAEALQGNGRSALRGRVRNLDEVLGARRRKLPESVLFAARRRRETAERTRARPLGRSDPAVSTQLRARCIVIRRRGFAKRGE